LVQADSLSLTHTQRDRETERQRDRETERERERENSLLHVTQLRGGWTDKESFK
jgi:hypothetical protein